MLEDTARLHRQFFGRAANSRIPAWEPPVDVFEKGGDLWIVLALPGVEPRAVEVAFEQNRLSVCAQRELPQPLREARILRLELPWGHFERHIELPPGVYRLIERGLDHGCLWIRVTREEGPSR
jgi:HSP20 family protein